MTRVLAAVLIASVSLAGTAALAEGSDNAAYRKNQELRALWAAERAGEPTPDPITALINLFSDEREVAETSTDTKNN